MNKELG